jgi:hypothetical protein
VDDVLQIANCTSFNPLSESRLAAVGICIIAEESASSGLRQTHGGVPIRLS